MQKSVAHISEILFRVLEEEAKSLARTTGCIKRERKLNGADLAQSLIFGWLQLPQETLDGLCQVLGRRQVHLTASAITQHFTKETAHFLEELLGRLTAQHLQAEHQVPTELLQRFSAVCIEDSSSIELPKDLQTVWKGCGSRTGATSALKLHARWDAVSGRLEGPCLTEGKRNDKRSPLALEQLPAGSLYLADLGYFSGERFCCIKGGKKRGKAKGYFLSRYRAGTALLWRQGQVLKLQDLVPQEVGECKQRLVLLGKSQRLLVRLLMERVPEEVARQRRARVQEAAHNQGRVPSEETLWLCDWTLLVTNAPERLLNMQEAMVMQHLRWQIEHLFRLWKEAGRVDTWRSKKPWRILCEVYAKLAAMVIQHWLIVVGTWQDPHRSLVKAAQVVRREAGSLMVGLAQGHLELAVALTLECMQSGCRQNVRQQWPSTAQSLEGAALPIKRRTPTAQYRRRDQWERWPAGKGWACDCDQGLPVVAASP